MLTIPITVLAADDHPLFRAGLRALLEPEADIRLIGEARDGAEAVKLAKELEPDVVLLDMNMPKLDGLGALAALREQVPKAHVIILTAQDDASCLFRVVEAGGAGYVLKSAAEDEVLGAIRMVASGGAFVRPPIAALLATAVMADVEAGTASETYERLTPREKEVLALVAHGMTNQAIADDLVISARTVETHRAHIMDKLGFHSRAELVRYALRLGYLS